MKNNSAMKRVLNISLLLIILLCLLSAVMLIAHAEKVNLEMKSNQPIFTGIDHDWPLTLKNGTKIYDFKTIIDYNRNTLQTHSVDGKNAYCIQPGVPVTNSNQESDTIIGFKYNGDNYEKWQEVLIKLIIACGYSDPHEPTAGNWDKASEAEKEKLYSCYATQMLIWEVVTKERDENMNHVGSKYYVLESIRSTSNSYHNKFKGYYDSIVAAVKENMNNAKHIGTNNYNNPSSRTVTGEPLSDDIGTCELKLNKNNFHYEGTINNSLIKDSSLTNCFLKDYISISGQELFISIPIQEAVLYQNTTYSGSLGKTTSETSEPKLINKVAYPYKTANQFKLYTGGQYMVVAAGTTDNVTYDEYYEKVTTTHKCTIYFKIKIPSIHVHKWIPHRITPTCTTQGLMCWECSCGKVITADYGFTSGTAPFVGEAGAIHPKKYDFTTGIVKADGHGEGKWITTVAPTCTTDGVEQKICEKCGVVLESRTLSATGHTSGDDSILVQTVAPSRTSKGEYQIRCGKCGVVQGTKEIPMHEHNSKGGKITATPATCYSEGSKGTVCSECGVIWKTEKVPAGHSKETVTITTKPATCTENGEAKMLCTDCGMMISTIVLPKLGHTDEDVWFTQTESTCEQDGESAKLCTRCGKITDTKKINALGHDEGVWTTTIEPTCELDGEKVLTCTRCVNINESKSIDKLNHDDGYWKIDVEATPDHNGIKSLYCSRCQVLKESEEFTLHTHEDGYEIVTLKPTCTADGQKGTVCKICNTCFKTETVKSEGHKFNDTFTNGDGTHSKRCKICGYESKENCNIKSVTKVNDCFDIGYTTNECEICSYNYVSGIKEAKGHNYNKWEDFNNTTHVRYCKNCPVAEYTLHQFDEYVSDNNASGSNPGTKTRTCIYCAKKETVKAESTCITVIAKVSEKTFSLTLLFLELFFLVLDFAEKTGLVHFKKG